MPSDHSAVNSLEYFTSGFNINNLHNDYVKSLAFSEKSGALFTGGFDGKILMMKLEESTKNSGQINLSSDYISLASNSNSIFAIDCDLNGDILLASVYENVNFSLILFDTRMYHLFLGISFFN